MNEQQKLNKKALLSISMVNENPAINVIIKKIKQKWIWQNTCMELCSHLLKLL